MSDKKILVADYNTRELQHLKKLFTDEGFEVFTVLDGKAALEAFFAENPDVVLLSAMLSKINGFDVCKQIKESDTGRNVPVIVATSVYKGQKYRLKAIHENKASEFIEKPFPDDKLIDTVRRFLGDTRSLIDTRKGEMLETVVKREEPVAEPTVVIPAALMAPPPDKKPSPPSEKKAPPAAETKVPPPVAPAPKSAARQTDSVEQMLQAEITATLIATETRPGEAEADDSMDKLLSDTLSGLGLDLDRDKSKPAKAESAPPKPAPVSTQTADGVVNKLMEEAQAAAPPAPHPAVKPDTAEVRMGKLEAELTQEGPPKSTEKAVESFLRSFDTDLEKKLSDTLSGVGLSDTNIEKVIEPAAKKPAAVEEPPVEEGTKFGEYLLDKKIGHGGMAELYRAKKRGQEGFQKIVAIKRILPHLSDNQELVTMFIDEAKIAAQLSHQNIVNIFDFGKISNSYYIAMEFVDGFDLKKALSRAKEASIRVPHKIAAYIALQIASALDYAHHKKDFNNRDLNIVHRDVSPQNILISREGEVKLVDFGISKAESKIHHTVKGALKGKLLYMSPEQAWGKLVDKRSDLYSLGIVLCEMVSGKVLFEDSSEFDVLEKVRSGRIPLLEHEMAAVPPRLKQIIDKALQIDMGKRYQTSGEMAKDLHDYVNVGGPVPSPKDIRAFLTRLFPDVFGLKDSEVQNMTFDEFLEREETVPAKAMSEETVILESEEMAGLEAIRPDMVAKPDLGEEEIIVESKLQPVQPLAAPVKAPEAPAAPSPEKPLVIKKEKKKAGPPEAKKKEAPAPPRPVPLPKPEPPKKAEKVKEEEEKKVLTKRLKDKEKEKKLAAAEPMFGGVTEKKSSNKTALIAIVAIVIIAAAAAGAYFMLNPKPQTPATSAQPPVQEQPAAPTGTEPSPAAPETQPAGAAQAPETRPAQPPPTPAPVPAQPPSRQTTPPAHPSPTAPETRPAQAQPQPPAAAQPQPQPAPATRPPEPTREEATAQPTERAAEPQPTPPAPQPQPAARQPQTQPAARQPEPAPAQPAPARTETRPTPAPDIAMSLPTAEQRVKEGDIVPLDADVKPPQLVKQVQPRIPIQASRMNVKGRLVCRILVSHTGAVEKVQVVSADSARVRELYSTAAEEALMQWKYTPAEKGGVKVKVWKTVTLGF
jgi:serine/threonine protein kinase/CheY-like chemotaxis protein